MPCRGGKDVETISTQQRIQEQTSTEDMNDKNCDDSNDQDSVNERQLKSVDNNDAARDSRQITGKTAKTTTAKKTKNVAIKMDAKFVDTGDETEEQVKDAANSLNGEKSNINNLKSSTDVKKRERSGRSCCSSSSVEVKDSLKPFEPMPGKGDVTNDAVDEIDDESERGSGDYVEDSDDDGDIVYFDDKENEINFRPSSKKGVKKRMKTNQGYVDDESPRKSSKSLGLSSKKGKYSLQQAQEDPLYASIDNRSPVKAGKKKRSSPQKTPTPQSSLESEQDDDEGVKVRGEGRYKKKKQKKPKMEDTDEAMEMQSVYESQIASLQNNPTLQTEHYSGADFSATGQPTIEIERDLLDNADEERKKNKQRLRERKMKETEEQSHLKVATDPTVLAYENAQKEIDKVLGPRQKGDEEGKKEKKSSKSKQHGKNTKKEKERKEKEDEKDEDEEEQYQEREKPPESLDEARQKMHKLLDDAFSLFSQSRSSMGKVHPSSKENGDEKSSPVSQRSHASHSTTDSAKELTQPKPEEKKHTPLFVERSHGTYDNSGLISWSPYRASDETALISLPTTQTNINADPPQRETITTSTFSESLPSSLRPNYYTTLPGEPIVIKMQDLDNKSPKPSKAVGEKEPRDVFSEPYYGMSSYQEIPEQSAVQTLTANGSAKNASQFSPRNENGNYIDVRAHTAPGRGENKNNDVLDVIKQSVQPGASPEPLISSLRDELMSLSMKRNVSSASNPKDDKDVKN